jgi:hypothetical protein
MIKHQIILFLQEVNLYFPTSLSSIEEFINNNKDNVPLYALVLGAIGIVIAFLGFGVATTNLFYSHILPRLITFYDRWSLNKQLDFIYTDDDLKEYLKYYIEPFVTAIDPSRDEEPHATINVKSGLFITMDGLLNEDSEHTHIILLADSGMGKTSALLNYAARHYRRFRRKYQLKIVPLSDPKAIEKISNIKNQHNVVLFLDAFDEDTLAIKDHNKRLDEIMKATYNFRRVVISCRTQFFLKDEDIPLDPGILRVAPRAVGERASYVFHKMYLSPFTREQAGLYLKQRFPLWKLRGKYRRQAFEMVEKIEHLAARPMLLAHIPALVKNGKRDISYSVQIYEEMVRGWLEREVGFIDDKDEMRRFSEMLAVYLFLNRQARKSEHVSPTELLKLARKWRIPIEKWKKGLPDWQIRTRSLLNRDAAGNYKFSHQSILEYFFVKRYIDGDKQCTTVDWTDQMRSFYWEFLEQSAVEDRKLAIYNEKAPNLNNLDRKQEDFLRLIALHGLTQLESPVIAEKRLVAILETVTALSGFLIDPHGTDSQIVSLCALRREISGEDRLIPLAVYCQGTLLDPKNTKGLQQRHSPENNPKLYQESIPNIDEENYLEIILKLQRVNNTEGELGNIPMPIKKWNNSVGLLISESGKKYVFHNWQPTLLLGILRLLGKYLWQYREKFD